MRVLIFHGYLLRGTGSNVYNAELARALLAAGHDVDLVCQDRAARDLDWIGAFGHWDERGELVVEDLGRRPAAGSGFCTAYAPPIGDLLPVYVQDDYEGFTARTFDRLDEDELAFYVERNVAAVRAVARRARPDFALANHMIMGPHIVAEALGVEIPLVAKIHGSAMEYIVRPHPRFLPYARSGVGAARAVLVGSRHIAERTLETLEMDGLERRVWLGPPGVDTERFRRLERGRARTRLAELAEEVEMRERQGYGPAQEIATKDLLARTRPGGEFEKGAPYEQAWVGVRALQRAYRPDGIDADAGKRLAGLSQIGGAPLALYVGKLIVSKGVDLLIAAWPLVLADRPDARLLVTGFGAYREGLEMLIRALSEGDLAAAIWIARGGRALEGGEPRPLRILTGFLEGLAGDELARYLAAARSMSDSIAFVGRFEHDLIAPITPAANCQVVPSTFPEAFGMVAAEAAACGVPPICAGHSGLAEVTARLGGRLSSDDAALLGFEVGDDAIRQIAGRISAAFALPDKRSEELAASLAETAVEEFSWAGVARELIAAGSGDQRSLRRP